MKHLVFLIVATLFAAIGSSSPDVSVRLVGGPNSWSGRVEVYSRSEDEWGTVCKFDEWNVNDARVICRHLGFAGVLSIDDGVSAFGQGVGPILSSLNCGGTENSVDECPWGVWAKSFCIHRWDVGVTCQTGNITAEAVRLVDDPDPGRGRVEVYIDGQWGTLCEDHFGQEDADVICRQLGFPGVQDTFTSNDGVFGYAERSTPILRNLDCNGTENNVQECRIEEWESDQCYHANDINLVCQMNVSADADVPVRLVGGPSSGRVEVYSQGEWRSICDDDWGVNEAQVVCRQLGFIGVVKNDDGLEYGYGVGPILSSLKCDGTENSVGECSWGVWATNLCRHYEDVGITCRAGNESSTVRLVGGPDASSGRVEIFLMGQWGTICHHHKPDYDTWTEKEASVLCRQLGFPWVQEVLTAEFGPGDSASPILGYVECTGVETSLRECETEPWDIRSCDHYKDVGVVCQTNDVTTVILEVSTPKLMGEDTIQIRLVDGPTSNSGRIEIYHNDQWWTICNDFWGIEEASVACRHLGFTAALRIGTYLEFGAGSSESPIGNIDCDGMEDDLDECQFEWSASNCKHDQDAGVVCLAEPTSLEVRIVGPQPNAGRLEVFYSGTWGTICDNYWDKTDAEVVCRQLGFVNGAVRAGTLLEFGQGAESQPILLSNIKCNGSESTLIDCPNAGWTVHRCIHREDAGVICAPNVEPPIPVRLAGSGEYHKGRVEVYYEGHWGTVCHDNWDLLAASVVCRQLGFQNATKAISKAGFGEGVVPIFLDEVACFGWESRLADCPSKKLRFDDCIRGEDAGVVCSEKLATLRLVDGPDASRGRVEVYLEGQWGTVCGDEWSEEEATIVCRQLGFPGVQDAFTTEYGAGDTTSLNLGSLDCDGTEYNLQECRVVKSNSCDSERVVGVACLKGIESQTVRLADGGKRDKGRVEVYRDGQWGTICALYWGPWGQEEAKVVCRELGFPGVQQAHTTSFGPGDPQSPILGFVRCTGWEARLADCETTEWNEGDHLCNHRKDVGVYCLSENPPAVPVQLVGGPNSHSGRVELYSVDGHWFSICRDGWSATEAAVVCRQLGFSGVESSDDGVTELNRGKGNVLASLDCDGTETSVRDCVWGSLLGVLSCSYGNHVGITCKTETSVRLIGPEPNLGRVEMMDHLGQWGTICDHGWDKNDADVVCRQLGFRKGAVRASMQAEFGMGSGPILLTQVQCRGRRKLRLEDCRSIKGVDGDDNKCSHSDDAGVVCQLNQEPATKVRLAGSESANQGRVEIYSQGEWGTVCDDEWDFTDANIVCKQLEFAGAVRAVGEAGFGEGSGQVYLGGVACRGEETKLEDCPSDDRVDSQCTHSNDAGVMCIGSHNLRLANGSKTNQGRVELYHDGQWGSVCNDRWTPNKATVVCRQLGFSGVSSSNDAIAAEGKGEGPILLALSCNGTELDVAGCDWQNWGTVLCSHEEDVAVTCETEHAANEGDIRLIGGESEAEGRVEIYMGGSWGTVCDTNWDLGDAFITCQQLGYPIAQRAFIGSHFQGTEKLPFHLDNVRCLGDEQRLAECVSTNTDITCTKDQTAGVRCA